MRLKTTLTLLALVGALLLVLRLTREQPLEQGNVSVSLLMGRRLGSAVRIQWQQADMGPIELRRAPGGPFRLSHPIDDLASTASLVNIANTYDSAMIGETPLPDTPANRQLAGLEPPKLVVDVDFEDGSKEHLEFGAEGPLGTDVFVRRGGTIYRGGLALFTSLQLGIDDLRERIVFRTTAPLAQQVVVDQKLASGPRERLRLVRQGDGWSLVEPYEARADAGAAESFVRNILALRIDTFPDSVLRLPDGPADIAVTIVGGPREEKLNLWLDAGGNLFGQIEDRRIYFKCTNDQYSQVFVGGADQLRSRVLLPLGDFYHEIVTVMVETGGDAPRTVVHRETADHPWSLREPVIAEVEATAVNELLTAVNNLQALSFLPPKSDPARYGIRTDGLSISVQGQADPRPAVVRLGNDGVEAGVEVTYAARADAMNEIVTVPRGAIGVLRRPWANLVARRIFAITSAVTRLDLQRGANGAGGARHLVNEGGAWSDRAGAAVDDAELADCVDRLRDLKAKGVRIARLEPPGPADWSLVMARSTDPPSDIGFGALDVWDHPDQPLLVRRRDGMQDLLFELSPTDSRNLRQLWH